VRAHKEDDALLTAGVLYRGLAGDHPYDWRKIPPDSDPSDDRIDAEQMALAYGSVSDVGLQLDAEQPHDFEPSQPDTFQRNQLSRRTAEHEARKEDDDDLAELQAELADATSAPVQDSLADNPFLKSNQAHQAACETGASQVTEAEREKAYRENPGQCSRWETASPRVAELVRWEHEAAVKDAEESGGDGGVGGGSTEDDTGDHLRRKLLAQIRLFDVSILSVGTYLKTRLICRTRVLMNGSLGRRGSGSALTVSKGSAI